MVFIVYIVCMYKYVDECTILKKKEISFLWGFERIFNINYLDITNSRKM